MEAPHSDDLDDVVEHIALRAAATEAIFERRKKMFPLLVDREAADTQHNHAGMRVHRGRERQKIRGVDRDDDKVILVGIAKWSRIGSPRQTQMGDMSRVNADRRQSLNKAGRKVFIEQ